VHTRIRLSDTERGEESRSAGELQNKLSELLEILHTREDALMIEARWLSSYVEECDEQLAEICKDHGRTQDSRPGMIVAPKYWDLCL